jgi:Caspase domain
MTQKTFSNGHALLIGVGADLPVTVKDATALRDVLVNPGRAAYPPEQVETLTQTVATRQGIIDAFDRLITRVNQNPDATVIVYFSGHGMRLKSTNEYFLIPYGYDPSRRADTAVSGLEFTKKIEAIKARKLVVLLDCCHAGGIPKDIEEAFVKSPVPPNLLEALDTGSGRVVVASSSEEELSYTGTPYSIFTACLLEALSGKAAVKKDGYARILEILIYLFNEVPQRAPGSQHPFVKKVLDLDDNFPLCYYAGGSKFLPGEIPSDEQNLSTAVLTVGQRERLKGKLKIVERDYNLQLKKVDLLRKAKGRASADPLLLFKLEQELLEE